jgi:hypothetical protein
MNENLLEDFVKPEIDIDNYRKSYSKYRLIAILATSFDFLFYSYGSYSEPTLHDISIIEILLGSALVVIVYIILISLLIATLLAIVWYKKFSFKERFKKLFWVVSLWVSFVFLILS